MAGGVVRTRFAASTDCALDAGSARVALANWRFARENSGAFILHIDKTKEERLIGDLLWLGIGWDEGPDLGGDHGPYRHAERREIYDRFTQYLLDQGRAYYCFCASETCSGRCATIARVVAASRRGRGEASAIRLRVPADVAGGDVLLMLSDVQPSASFTLVIDDVQMKITHVFGNAAYSAKEIAIFQALGFDPPVVTVMPSISGPSIAQLRETGVLPEALTKYLSQPDLSAFDDEALYAINHDCLQQADPARILSLARVYFPHAALHPDWLASVIALLLPTIDCLSQLPSRAAVIFNYDPAVARKILKSKPETDRERIAITGQATELDLDKLVQILEAGATRGLVMGPEERKEKFMAAAS
jgi:glutamyl/glutaminyl-tRNA synthetase